MHAFPQSRPKSVLRIAAGALLTAALPLVCDVRVANAAAENEVFYSVDAGTLNISSTQLFSPTSWTRISALRGMLGMAPYRVLVDNDGEAYLECPEQFHT